MLLILRERREISWCPVICSIRPRVGLRGYTRWVECDEIDLELDNRSKIMFALAGKAAEAVCFNYGPGFIDKLISSDSSDLALVRSLTNDEQVMKTLFRLTYGELKLQWARHQILREKLTRQRALYFL